MRRQHLAVLLILGALWGASFLFIKLGVREMPPEILVAIRLCVGSLTLLGVLAARGQGIPLRLRLWLDLLFVGVVGLVIPYELITWGEQHIASGMAAILNATTPLFSALLTFVWTREERLDGMRLLGVGIGFVGVVVAVGIEHLSLSSADAQAHLAVLLAALCYAITGIYSRRAFRGMPALVPAAGQLIAGAVVITPIALLLRGIPSPLPSALALGAVLALGVVGTAIAYILLYWLLERLGATRTSMVTYLLPPFALVYGALFLSEAITLDVLLGLALVIVGILLANGMLRIPAAQPRPAQGIGDGG